jgi:pimeloyl-ACP methyl ester carboxylesterase
MGNGLSVPFTVTRRRIGDIALHTVEAGPEDGPLVILLHGFPDFWWGWRRQIGPLARAGLRVVAPDQRGYGLSSKPQGLAAYGLEALTRDVVGLADAYGRSRIQVVGHDWGGLVAWWAATRYPERLERLAILNAPHPGVVEPYLRSHPRQVLRSSYVGFFQLPWLPEAVLGARRHAALRQTLLRTSRRGTFTRTDLDRYEEAWAEPGALTAMLNWYRALRLRPPSRDARVHTPTLVIWGTHDQALERGLAEASLALCDEGRIVWLEAAGHWVHLEEAAAVNAALVDFLRAPPPAGGRAA